MTGPKKSTQNVDRVQVSGRGSPLFAFFVQFFLVALIFFAIGFVVGQRRLDFLNRTVAPKLNIVNKYPPKEQTVDFSLFWEVLDALPQKYIDKSAVDGQKILYGAISGMVRSLGDPYTAFFDPKQNQSLRSDLSGSYEGVGIQIGFNEDKRLVVIAPLKGTPAEKSGVLARDLILKIGDRDTFDITLPEAVDLIRGEAGSKVKLSLQHENSGDSFDVEIERAKITVKSVELEFRQKGNNEVAVFKVSRFGETTDREWDEAVGEISRRGNKKVIVDMRNNPGGLLASAIHLSSEFVRGTVVKQEFADGSIQSLPTDHAGKLLDVDLVVLVNDGSASASEIFAGAVQDKSRGKIVGKKTFGKGTVQDAVELPGGSGLHVTVARWLTPDGHSIHQKGIEPDEVVDLFVDDQKAQRDPQFERALDLI